MVDSSSQQLGERAGEEWRLVESGGKGRPQGQEALLAADPTRPEEGGLVAGEQGLKANGDEVSQEELGLPDDHRVGWLEGGGVGSQGGREVD